MTWDAMGLTFALLLVILAGLGASLPSTKPMPKPMPKPKKPPAPPPPQPPAPQPPPEPGVPEAIPDDATPPAGDDGPLWPLPGVSAKGKPKWGGRFRSSRRNGTKFHTGIDLGAPAGSVIVAPEPGRLVSTQGWDGPQAKALFLETDRGPVVMLGAVAPSSWPTTPDGKLDERHVARGEPVARVGTYPHGGTMLHLELYKRGTRHNRKWYANKPKPTALIDPTDYVESFVQA